MGRHKEVNELTILIGQMFFDKHIKMTDIGSQLALSKQRVSQHVKKYAQNNGISAKIELKTTKICRICGKTEENIEIIPKKMSIYAISTPNLHKTKKFYCAECLAEHKIRCIMCGKIGHPTDVTDSGQLVFYPTNQKYRREDGHCKYYICRYCSKSMLEKYKTERPERYKEVMAAANKRMAQKYKAEYGTADYNHIKTIKAKKLARNIKKMEKLNAIV